MTGIRKRWMALMFLCLIAAASAVTAQAGTSAAKLKITKLSCTAPPAHAYTMITCTFTTNVPAQTSVALGVDRIHTPLQTDKHYRTKHSISAVGVTTPLPYNVLVTATNKTGQTAKAWTIAKLAAVGSAPVKLSATKAGIRLNGQRFFPIITEVSSCEPSADVTVQLSVPFNMVAADFLDCGDQGATTLTSGEQAVLQAVGNKGWLVAPIDQLQNPAIANLPQLVGWEQADLPEIQNHPSDLPGIVGSGKLTFLYEGMSFWSGITPDWIGQGAQPTWSSSLFLQYANHGDVVGFKPWPGQGTCNTTEGMNHSPTLTDIYSATVQMAKLTSRAQLSFVNLQPTASRCHPPAFTPSRAMAELMVPLTAGTNAIEEALSSSTPASVRVTTANFNKYVASLGPVLNTPATLVQSGSVRASLHHYGGNTYVLAVNTNDKTAATLNLNGLGASMAKTWTGPTGKVTGGSLNVKFGPAGSAIYQIVPLAKK